eukprot:9490186-Pyramimonas_sp.AAC.1
MFKKWSRDDSSYYFSPFGSMFRGFLYFRPESACRRTRPTYERCHAVLADLCDLTLWSGRGRQE